MSAAEMKKLFPDEAALCAAFIREFNTVEGWVCYPETGGFDVLVVHTSGRQIGVEAKMQLNAKVCDQILPSYNYDAPRGPDHRLVIVPYISDGAKGIAKMLRMLGVEVWEASVHRSTDKPFYIDSKIRQCDAEYCYWEPALFDWNPAERLPLPQTMPEVQAGVPSPSRLTPWKEGALRVLAHLEVHGSITRKQICEYGISPSMWTQAGWLDRGDQGHWIENLETPRHHSTRNPLAYQAALAYVRAKEKT